MALCKTTTPAYRGQDAPSRTAAPEWVQALLQAALPHDAPDSHSLRDWLVSLVQDVFPGDEPARPAMLIAPRDPCDWARSLLRTATPTYASKPTLCK